MDVIIVVHNEYRALSEPECFLYWYDKNKVFKKTLVKFLVDGHDACEYLISDSLPIKMCFIGDVFWKEEGGPTYGSMRFFSHLSRPIPGRPYPEHLYYIGNNQKFFDEYLSSQKNVRGKIKPVEVHSVIKSILAPQVGG